ncbi:MAG: hypothetical protein R3F49_16760 [Planctomycetota bacterium]
MARINEREERPNLRARLAVLFALVAAACVGGQVAERAGSGVEDAWRDQQGSQNGWWSERGLVIPHASFPADCRLCHVEGAWSELRADFTFDHAAETGVPLEGAHAAAQCLRCHNDRGPVQAFSQRGCIGCHNDVHQGARGTNCGDCHGQQDWRVDEEILAHAATRFPLLGPHAAAACRDCHVGIEAGVMEPLDTSCASCHTKDLSRALEPNHVALGWTASCDDCHQVSTFGAAGFVHAGFPLEGGHAGLDCSQCHVGNQFAGTRSDCAGCHTADYQATTNPSHASLSFPMTCQQCHTTSTWSGAAFDHSNWPLTGAHRQTSCNECHSGGVFQGTPATCVGCHQTDFNQTSDPSHGTAGFATTCQDCHTTTGWTPSTFAHSSFALTGAHGAASCNACHGGGVFSGTPSTCVGCHLGDFQGTTNPNHTAMGFPTSCDQCHGTTTWQGAAFDHSSWALTGAHAATSCNACHGGGVYAGTPTTCVACHQAEYNNTTDPNHTTAGFPTSCQDCHSTTTWDGAEFDHSSFELTGAHATATCASCHGGGVFSGTPSACVACHQSEFNGTTSPNHTSLGYPTSCQDCHGTTMWEGATFNHTWFPITSGDHRNFACNECHLVPNNTSTFSCTHCHEHRQSSMAGEHQGVQNYVWQSSACYQCHPDGREHARAFAPPRRTVRPAPNVPPAPGPTPIRPPHR